MRKLAALLFVGLATYASAAETASTLLKDAETKASTAKKNVLVIFHASWCGWCHKLDDFLANPAYKPIFDKNYEVVHVDVQESDKKKDLETPGGQELSDQFHATKQGLPFFVILDPNGKELADSAEPSKTPGKDPANIGYPSEPHEVTYFMSVLHKTANHLSDEDAAKVEAFLRAKPAGATGH